MPDSKRLERYKHKIRECKDRFEFIKRNLPPESIFLRERLERKGVYKEFQEMAEAVADICAMLTKDSGQEIDDDYSNIERACEILSCKEIMPELKRINGLRNVIIHEYNGIIDEEAYKSMNELLPSVEKFAEAVETWIGKK